MKKDKVFAEGLCLEKICTIFIIFSVFGCYYEMILEFVKRFIKDGTIFWETRSAVLYGPFNVIYGLGAVIVLLILGRKYMRWYKVFIYGSLIGGLFEYICSFLQEKITSTTSWNYSHQLLSINGRTTIPIMIGWGLICLIFIKWIYPHLSNLIESIPNKTGTIILSILMILLCIDMLLSFSAVLRQNFRQNNMKPISFFGEFLDKYYPDERIKKAYPLMRFVER